MSSEQLSVSLNLMEQPATVRQLIGENVRRIRTEKGVAADVLAQQMQIGGFKWTSSRVSEVERGQKPLSIEELLALTYSLGVITASLVKLADLFEGDHRLEINPDVYWASGDIRKMFLGEPVGHPGLRPNSRGFFRSINLTQEGERFVFGVAEKRAQKKFNLSDEELSEAFHILWGRTLSQERDKRVGGGSAQKKGHVTRELMEELADYLESEDGDD